MNLQSLKQPIMAIVLALTGVSVGAVEVADVQVAESAKVGGKALQLNGAGLRSKFFVKVYVGALYLEQKTTDGTAAINMAGPKRVAMHVIYDDLSAEKISEAWLDGFRGNHSDAELAALTPRITSFNALFPSMTTGDVALIDTIPGAGTTVTLNGKALGTIDGDDFGAAVVRIWLGDNPADGDLKSGMLGG